MDRLSRLDPRALTLWFLCVVALPVFVVSFHLSLVSFFGALAFSVASGGFRVKKLAWIAFFPLALAALNPVINRDGVTVLFFFNNSPVTLEAVLYGALTGFTVSGVILWFDSFSRLMTADKWLFVLSGISSKFALTVSMALRFVPDLSKKLASMRDTQRALGLYTADNVIDRLRSELRVFSALITWALENGVTTADSMESRGFGCGRRTYFSRHKPEPFDAVFFIYTLIFAFCSFIGVFSGTFDGSFYPVISVAPAGPRLYISLFFCVMLSFWGVFVIIFEELKWKRLLSRI